MHKRGIYIPESSPSDSSVSSELEKVTVRTRFAVAVAFVVSGATDGRPVLESRMIFGTGLEVLARIRRGWFSRLL
jgi:hypothetical protein